MIKYLIDPDGSTTLLCTPSSLGSVLFLIEDTLLMQSKASQTTCPYTFPFPSL
jgi:hypothetical protein